MLKNKLNFRLINLVLIALLVWISIATSHFWLWWARKVFEVLAPFALAFTFAYIAYPLVKFLEKKGIHKNISIALLIVAIVGFMSLTIYLLIPLMYDQIVGLISNIIKFVQDISLEYGLDLNYIQSRFSSINNTILDLGKYMSGRAIQFINVSISVATTLIIAFFTGIYLLLDMDKIRNWIRDFFSSKKEKTFEYVRSLDIEMKNYFIGLSKNILVQLVEYTLVYYLIGHPYFLILGILASFTSIIPYFGGLIAGIFALLSALVVSSKLFVLTLIVCLIVPNIDGYFWAPKIYGKSNNINPVITIFGVFTGGILLGFVGIVIALPVTILITQTIKIYKKEIFKMTKKKS